MRVEAHLDVSAEEFFERLLASVCYDIQKSTGKRKNPDLLKRGFSYAKPIHTKLGHERDTKVKITRLERPRAYTCSFEAMGDVNTVAYDLTPTADGGIDVVYEETFGSQKKSRDVNGKIVGKLYEHSAKKRMLRQLQAMERYIQGERRILDGEDMPDELAEGEGN